MRRSRTLCCTRHRVTMFLLMVGLLAASGCGDGKIARYPVTGTVMVDSKPAEGAIVILCPIEGEKEFMRERPIGRTDAAGKFELLTFGDNDGAPAGPYKVTVSWPSTTGGDPRDNRPNRSGGPDRLRGRYSDLETTDLVATINEGPTELPPLDLTTR